METERRSCEGVVNDRPAVTHRSCSRLSELSAIGAFLLLAASASVVRAHPIPQGTHDRTITVQLMPTEVVVQYRLEIHPHTLIFVDLQREVEQGLISEPKEFFATFEQLYRTRLAAGLTAELDGNSLVFACRDARHQWLNQGKEDEHVRYDFLFVAPWKPEDRPDQQFAFSDKNYEKDGQPMPGRVQISLAADPSLNVSGPIGPLAAGMRDLHAEFNLAAAEQEDEDSSLLQLFFTSNKGFWILLLLAVGLGAAHALTPGHGKTLVAAYLIGERGTMRHAIVLGLVTTLTHTGVVLILALVLWLSFPNGISSEERSNIQQALGLGGGLLIAALGLWLLFRRLSGKADHIHFGGAGHHHHHHHDHDHAHDHHHGHDHDHSHDHVHPMPGGWRGLVALGVTGGIVPCWDAVALLLAAVAMNMLWLALPMLLAFSAGLAGVLVAIGIVVVRTKAFAGKRWEQSRLYRALPLISAALVTGLGIWLCYKSLVTA